MNVQMCVKLGQFGKKKKKWTCVCTEVRAAVKNPPSTWTVTLRADLPRTVSMTRISSINSPTVPGLMNGIGVTVNELALCASHLFFFYPRTY